VELMKEFGVEGQQMERRKTEAGFVAQPLGYVSQNAETREKSLCAGRAFAAGEIICAFGAREILSEPSRMTIQIGAHRHILLYPVELEFTNHSCDPNIFFDTSHMLVRSLRPIAAGEELRFFYPSTEWEMAEPFYCHCGAAQCLSRVAGASQMPPHLMAAYQLSDFIKRKLERNTTPGILKQ